MTDNTQELDCTHPDEMPIVEHRPDPYSDLRGMIVHFTSEMLDNPYDNGIYPTTNFYNDLEAAILAWHNRQTVSEIEAVLDRLEQGLPDTAFHGTSIRVKEKIRDGGYVDGVRDSRLAIEAERNKLKESK